MEEEETINRDNKNIDNNNNNNEDIDDVVDLDQLLATDDDYDDEIGSVSEHNNNHHNSADSLLPLSPTTLLNQLTGEHVEIVSPTTLMQNSNTSNRSSTSNRNNNNSYNNSNNNNRMNHSSSNSNSNNNMNHDSNATLTPTTLLNSMLQADEDDLITSVPPPPLHETKRGDIDEVDFDALIITSSDTKEEYDNDVNNNNIVSLETVQEVIDDDDADNDTNTTTHTGLNSHKEDVVDVSLLEETMLNNELKEIITTTTPRSEIAAIGGGGGGDTGSSKVSSEGFNSFVTANEDHKDTSTLDTNSRIDLFDDDDDDDDHHDDDYGDSYYDNNDNNTDNDNSNNSSSSHRAVSFVPSLETVFSNDDLDATPKRSGGGVGHAAVPKPSTTEEQEKLAVRMLDDDEINITMEESFISTAGNININNNTITTMEESFVTAATTGNNVSSSFDNNTNNASSLFVIDDDDDDDQGLIIYDDNQKQTTIINQDDHDDIITTTKEEEKVAPKSTILQDDQDIIPVAENLQDDETEEKQQQQITFEENNAATTIQEEVITTTEKQTEKEEISIDDALAEIFDNALKETSVTDDDDDNIEKIIIMEDTNENEGNDDDRNLDSSRSSINNNNIETIDDDDNNNSNNNNNKDFVIMDSTDDDDDEIVNKFSSSSDEIHSDQIDTIDQIMAITTTTTTTTTEEVEEKIVSSEENDTTTQQINEDKVISDNYKADVVDEQEKSSSERHSFDDRNDDDDNEQILVNTEEVIEKDIKVNITKTITEGISTISAIEGEEQQEVNTVLERHYLDSDSDKRLVTADLELVEKGGEDIVKETDIIGEVGDVSASVEKQENVILERHDETGVIEENDKETMTGENNYADMTVTAVEEQESIALEKHSFDLDNSEIVSTEEGAEKVVIKDNVVKTMLTEDINADKSPAENSHSEAPSITSKKIENIESKDDNIKQQIEDLFKLEEEETVQIDDDNDDIKKFDIVEETIIIESAQKKEDITNLSHIKEYNPNQDVIVKEHIKITHLERSSGIMEKDRKDGFEENSSSVHAEVVEVENQGSKLSSTEGIHDATEKTVLDAPSELQTTEPNFSTEATNLSQIVSKGEIHGVNESDERHMKLNEQVEVSQHVSQDVTGSHNEIVEKVSFETARPKNEAATLPDKIVQPSSYEERLEEIPKLGLESSTEKVVDIIDGGAVERLDKQLEEQSPNKMTQLGNRSTDEAGLESGTLLASSPLSSEAGKISKNDPSRPELESSIASPFSLKASVITSQIQQTVLQADTKPTALQVEFPPVLDNGAKKSDIVSLSSASSTISHTSTAKGLLPGGMSSPPTSEDMIQRRGDALPPRIPKKGKDLIGSPKSFAESLSRKLNVQGGVDDSGSDPVESRWIRQALPTSFNPKKSIFAGKRETSKGPNMSPPGSPPEPVYSDSDIGSSYDGYGSDSTDSESRATRQTAATWDMIHGSDGMNWLDFLPDDIEAIRSPATPAAVNVEDFATESSYAASESEIGVQQQRRHSIPLKSFLSDVSHSSTARKRRGMARQLSATSRGSGRRSLSSTGKLRAHTDAGSGVISQCQSEGRGGLSAAFNDAESMTFGREVASEHVGADLVEPVLRYVPRSSPDLRKMVKQDDSLDIKPERLSLDALGSQTYHEKSGNAPIIDALDNDALSPEPLALRFSSQGYDRLNDRAHRGALLEEELLTFSSMRKIELPFRYSKPLDSLNYAGFLRWEQLESWWKHSEVLRAMMMRDPSPHFAAVCSLDTEKDERSKSSDKHRNSKIDDLVLNGVSLKDKRIRSETKNYNGFAPQYRERNLPSLTSFVANFGRRSSSNETKHCSLCHKISVQKDEVPTVEHLCGMAKSIHDKFNMLIVAMASFASKNEVQTLGQTTVSYATDIKVISAIKRKANYKYNGDIMQVKDILRAQITVPDEATLVCALVYLFRSAKDAEADGLEFSICRIKNLLCNESLSERFLSSSLPTGYRHLLLNLRFESGLLAEIQFNLAPLFDVLGKSGYDLHRELQDLDFALKANPGMRAKSSGFEIDGLIDGLISCGSSSESEEIFNSLSSMPTAVITKNNAAGKRCLTPPNTNNVDKLRHDEGTDREGRIKKKNDSEVSSIEEDMNMTPNAEFSNSFCEMVTPKAGQNISESSAHSSFVSSKNDALTPYSPEKRKLMLDELREHSSELHCGDILLAILECGSRSASKKPRDVATFYCLYVIFAYILKHSDEGSFSKISFGVTDQASIIEYSKRCLLRCLKISNQAISTGMMGWLEYGSSSSLDRLTERPFSVLRQLSYEFVRLRQLDDAECVLKALLTRCEQHLPLYHPTTLTALLDLAFVASKTDKQIFSERLVSRVAQRLSTYLSEMESGYFDYLSSCRSTGKPNETIFRIEHGRNYIGMLEAFASLFQSHIDRDMVTLIDETNEILLANYCFLADTLSVLANCMAAARSVLGTDPKDDAIPSDLVTAKRYWQISFAHYQRAFNGLIQCNYGLDDPSVARAIYGLSRCLREFGETEKALEILKLVVMSVMKPSQEEEQERTGITDKAVCEKNAGESTTVINRKLIRFLPQSVAVVTPVAMNNNKNDDNKKMMKYTSSALCLWLMSILSLDQSPNEEGRECAFHYLHAASVAMQSALMICESSNNQSNTIGMDFSSRRAVCIQFLAMIEEEAVQISEPIYE